MLKARLARFYGWTDKEMNSMSVSKVNEYFRCIEPLMAEESLNSMNAIAYPHLKKSSAKDLYKKVQKKTRFNVNTDAPESTEALYHHLIRTLGNG